MRVGIITDFFRLVLVHFNMTVYMLCVCYVGRISLSLYYYGPRVDKLLL